MPFVRGALESLALIAIFVSLGLGAAALGGRAPASYAVPLMAEDAPPVNVWIVDGFNVLHAAVLRGRDRAGWWRAEARERLLERVRSFQEPGAEVWVVFDGPTPPESAPAEAESLRVVFAPSADEWVLDRLRSEPDPTRLAVVTADRELAGRSRRRGARVMGPREFLARCSPY